MDLWPADPVHTVSTQSRRVSGRRIEMPLTNSRPTGWTADAKLWQELHRIAANYSWARIAFDSNLAVNVPEAPGVYLICAHPPYPTKLGRAAYTVLYAGKVQRPPRTLRARFLEHCKRPKPALRPFLLCFHPNVHFWWSSIADAEEVDQIETLLIESFNPPANMIRAPGTAVLLARLGQTRPVGPRGALSAS